MFGAPGGAFGAVGRYGVESAIVRPMRPWKVLLMSIAPRDCHLARADRSTKRFFMEEDCPSGRPRHVRRESIDREIHRTELVTIALLDKAEIAYSALKMTIEDHYKYLQRRIGRCGVLDSLRVIWAYSQFLQIRDFGFPDDIEKHVDFRADSRVGCMIHEW